MNVQNVAAMNAEAPPQPTPATCGGHVVCLVTIRMPDGSVGEHTGIYSHSVDAVVRALELFPQACKVSAFAWPFCGAGGVQ